MPAIAGVQAAKRTKTAAQLLEEPESRCARPAEMMPGETVRVGPQSVTNKIQNI
jgi:hypothetical protein